MWWITGVPIWHECFLLYLIPLWRCFGSCVHKVFPHLSHSKTCQNRVCRTSASHWGWPCFWSTYLTSWSNGVPMRFDTVLLNWSTLTVRSIPSNSIPAELQFFGGQSLLFSTTTWGFSNEAVTSMGTLEAFGAASDVGLWPLRALPRPFIEPAVQLTRSAWFPLSGTVQELESCAVSWVCRRTGNPYIQLVLGCNFGLYPSLNKPLLHCLLADFFQKKRGKRTTDVV